MSVRGASSASTVVSANPLTVYAAGTAYSLTNAAAAIVFGTTSPSLTLNAAGTYLIIARARMDYNGATFAATHTTTLKLRRTNNTAADLTSGSTTATSAIVTTITDTFIDQCWQVVYTTTNTNDAIALFGLVDTTPAAGSLDVGAASIVAVRLQT